MLGGEAAKLMTVDLKSMALIVTSAGDVLDGTLAVGLFNRGRKAADVTVKWSDLELRGAQPVRDLWRQKDLGTFADALKMQVPRQGAVLVKVGTPAKVE